MTRKELLHDWLRDAYGMEKALADYIDKSIKDFDGNESAQNDLRAFKAQNEAAIEKLDDELKRRDDKPSVVKNIIGNAIGFLSGAGSSAYHDSIVKNLLVIHGTFHFAHACYLSLASAASVMDDPELETYCKALAGERQAVAEWAEHMVPDISRQAIESSD